MLKYTESFKKTVGLIFLEAFLIGLSIISAFWLDNYREDLEIEHKKIEYYKRLIADLKTDSVYYHKIKANVIEQMNRIDRIIVILESKSINTDTLAKLISRSEHMFQNNNFYYMPDSYTINSIITSEQAQIFTFNYSFDLMIGYYQHRFNFLDGIRKYHEYCEQNLTPYIDKYFDRFSKTHTQFSVNDFKTNQLKNILLSAKDKLFVPEWIDFMSSYSENLKRHIEKELL
ncbi:MAG: hypothetical protein KDD94_13765 [Calditrichaeota bacterium]|nr:hypothetical protein [Calditrichota bacterium]